MLIAQLTDLHIKKGGKKAYRRVDTLDCLRKAVSHLNRLKPRPDYLVITGDLGDFGTPEEYQVIKQELLKVEMPMLIVPGNHDHRDNLRKGLKELVDFDHPEFCNFAVSYEEQVLIGLDSSVIGKPYGRLSAETLLWLEETLEQHQCKPALLFLHHPPMTVGLGHMDVQNLQNADELSSVLSRFSNIRGMIAGHLHRPITALWNSLPVWVGPSHSHSVTLDLDKNAPSSFSLEPNAIQLLKFEGDSVVSHISYISDSEGPYPFFNAQGNLID
ncbi:phosphodiesterase [Vibrio comitans]|uniref:3',5'-cyclic adenosine monophosphate phosphodiesterase CpdA n=1 Tax=Vibrio comitans NBRC 102076 TaxID=1219078 RepID=A0A4Y3INY7_9VIBR|nr:phosphodiesterase [Vibrio comitans]GEA61209.1 3',5'-cyclic adenosine monophosphate phosphodiesterase CpdA [Vibrio comitans NBRC 102076]